MLEPKLEIFTDALAPDSYDSALGVVPPENFVISRNRDGAPASVFGDLVWDFTAYNPDGRVSRLYFAYWGNGEQTEVRMNLSREVRCALFSLMWRRNGFPLSIRTLANYLTVLCAVARYAEDTKSSLAHVLGVDSAVFQFVDARCSGWMTETLGSLLPLLAQVGKHQLGFDIVSDNVIQQMKRRSREYRAGIKQHAPIPTRIYSHLILGLQRELEDWLAVAEGILAVLKVCGADPRTGRTVDQQSVSIKKLGLPREYLPTFEQITGQACRDHLQAKGKALDVRGISSLVIEAQQIAKLLIQTFTGMRDDEAASLPYHCLESTEANGKIHFVVKGRTTKLNNGLVKRTQWVTNRDGQRAVLAAQAIANTIYSLYGVTPVIPTSRTNDHPLFVSLGYANLSCRRARPEDGRFSTGSLGLRPNSSFPERIFATIAECDLHELEQVDPHRAWRSEDKFKIGQRWPFTSHQLRRSLALYGQRSGLVSLPSLRRQLQHITEEMSRYYARGSAFAKDFIGEGKEHFGLEWQESQSESAALSYILNVLLSNDTLFGGHANWVEHRLRGPDGTVLVDRKATLKRFKNGEIAYRETLIGGCVNIGDCDQVALKWLGVECLQDDCKNLVCSLTKLERVITAQERMVQALDHDSIEYRTENADLEVLVRARDKARQQQTRKTK